MKPLSFARSATGQACLVEHRCAEADRAELVLLAFRLLRHQTKNALQRIIAECAQAGLRRTAAGAALADDVQRRIILSAQISDALFGLTAEPATIERRLHSLVNATVELLGDGTQMISTEIEVIGCCPDPLVPVVLHAAHEMVGNAVLHGMHVRLLGKVLVSLISVDGAVSLQVRDDGWGPGAATIGEGHAIIASLARQHGGTVSLARTAEWTLAMMSIPAPA